MMMFTRSFVLFSRKIGRVTSFVAAFFGSIWSRHKQSSAAQRGIRARKSIQNFLNDASEIQFR
jgi:tRNA(His) 5'-end guanylyltransferase